MPIPKESVIAEIRKLAAEAGGRPPGVEVFAKKTGIKAHAWRGVHWVKWADALSEAGFSPNEWQRSTDEDELLHHLAQLSRRLGHFPTNTELRLEGQSRQDLPHAETFRKRLGSISDQIQKLQTWAGQRPEYADVLPFLETIRMVPRTAAKVLPSEGLAPLVGEELSESYIPPVVASLYALARQEPAIQEACATSRLTVEVEFERRVAIALELLGLKVRRLGQGHGRMPDGIAVCPKDGWALVYDAKAYRDGFRFGTEDRKFIEYIETSHASLEAEGIRNLYFGVISSAFAKGSEAAAMEIARKTRAEAVVLIEAEALVGLVGWRLRRGADFTFADLERKLTEAILLTIKSIPKAEETKYR